MGDDEGPSKRKKGLSKVASLANLFSSPISRPLQSARQALKKSISGMLHPAPVVHAGSTPNREQFASPSPAGPNSPLLLRSHKSILSLNRLTVMLSFLFAQVDWRA